MMMEMQRTKKVMSCLTWKRAGEGPQFSTLEIAPT